ncbi:MAG: hypothetical protein U5R49_07105 [Deltaproteobacteria bacterium]|nr:hypothetical protein [Deltaproteobacteria bacterium]
MKTNPPFGGEQLEPLSFTTYMSYSSIHQAYVPTFLAESNGPLPLSSGKRQTILCIMLILSDILSVFAFHFDPCGTEINEKANVLSKGSQIMGTMGDVLQ